MSAAMVHDRKRKNTTLETLLMMKSEPAVIRDLQSAVLLLLLLLLLLSLASSQTAAANASALPTHLSQA